MRDINKEEVEQISGGNFIIRILVDAFLPDYDLFPPHGCVGPAPQGGASD